MGVGGRAGGAGKIMAGSGEVAAQQFLLLTADGQSLYRPFFSNESPSVSSVSWFVSGLRCFISLADCFRCPSAVGSRGENKTPTSK